MHTKKISIAGLNQLEKMPLDELKVHYQEVFKTGLPDWCSRQFLIGNISWAIQAGKKHRVKRDQLVKQAHHLNISSKHQYLPGTRLVREWRGVTHEVVVVENRYRWQQRDYNSFSEVARAITGARWSWPQVLWHEQIKAIGSVTECA